MCEVCRMSPCHPRCPNAEEVKPEYVCIECGAGIYIGDKYLEAARGYVCEECLGDMNGKELLKLLDEKLETA